MLFGTFFDIASGFDIFLSFSPSGQNLAFAKMIVGFEIKHNKLSFSSYRNACFSVAVFGNGLANNRHALSL